MELPRALGFETRLYHLRADQAFRLDVDRILSLCDEHTRLVIINSPQNPTGACVSAAELTTLADALQHQGIPLLSDEVYWPLTYGAAPVSATIHPWPIVIGSASKALSLSGLPSAARRRPSR